MKEFYENDTADILCVEGVMAKGYGLSPQVVMRDRRLTPEAKCIYAYIASFAGSGNQAFPGRDLILKELNMAKNRFYRHFKYLKKYDYIRVERENISGSNLHGRNIYILVQKPKDDPNQADTAGKNNAEYHQNIDVAKSVAKADVFKTATSDRCPQNEDVETNIEKADVLKTATSGRCHHFRDVENDDTNNNILKKTDRCQSVSHNIEKKEDKLLVADRIDGTDDLDDFAISKKSLREKLKVQIAFNEVKEEINDLGQERLLDMIFECIIDMYYSNHVKINGSIKEKIAVRQIIMKLRNKHIRFVIEALISNKNEVKNRRAYIQSCIYNSVYDIEADSVINAEAKKKRQRQKERQKELDRLKEKEFEDEQQQIEKEKRKRYIYEKYPDIAKLDEKRKNANYELMRSVALRDGRADELKDLVHSIQDEFAAKLASYGYNDNFENTG